jgi:hypothetical protein
MLGNYFYHEVIRKTIIGFGTLFNGIEVRHDTSDGTVVDIKRVPLAYGPAAKFIARLDQQPELNKAVAITLPRMSFEMTSIAYDATRKAGITQTFKARDVNNNQLKKVFLPVPYNIGFELSLLTKLNDDALQVVEQILPFFQPSFSITIDLISSIGEKRDVPITLTNVNFQDDYEGDFSTRRALIYTFQFVAKTYLYGPIADNPEGIIKKVIVDQYASVDTVNARREMRYTATPTATKDYNSDGAIDSDDNDLIVPGDDFGFSETTEFFDDGKSYSPTKQEDI